MSELELYDGGCVVDCFDICSAVHLVLPPGLIHRFDCGIPNKMEKRSRQMSSPAGGLNSAGLPYQVYCHFWFWYILRTFSIDRGYGGAVAQYDDHGHVSCGLDIRSIVCFVFPLGLRSELGLSCREVRRRCRKGSGG